MSWKSMYYAVMSKISLTHNRKTFYDIMLEAEQEDGLLTGTETNPTKFLKWIQKAVNLYGHITYTCQVQVGKTDVHEVYKITRMTADTIELQQEKIHTFSITSQSQETIEIERDTINLLKLTPDTMLEESLGMNGVYLILQSKPHEHAIQTTRMSETYKSRNTTQTMEENLTTPYDLVFIPSIRIGIQERQRAEQLKNVFRTVIELLQRKENI